MSNILINGQVEAERLLALMEHLVEYECIDTIDEIEVDSEDNTFITIDDMEYKVLTDEEADDAFELYQQELIDDIGIDAFNSWARDYILMNFVDEDWFDNCREEYYQQYIEDIRDEAPEYDEKFENRLEEEMNDYGCENEEEFLEMLVNNYDSVLDWYIDVFGEADFKRIVQDKNLIDWDKVIDWTKREDGRGCLAAYDSEEIESRDYFLYRVN